MRPVLSRGGLLIVVMPRYPPSPRISWLPSRCATVAWATMTSLRLPGQQCPAITTRRRCAQMMSWVLTQRR